MIHYCLFCGRSTSALKCPACLKKIVMPRSQKVKGLVALRAFHSDIYSYTKPLTCLALLQSQDDIPQNMWAYEVFARPCPSEAQHGYIDSRKLHTISEVKALLAQVLEDDPNGELLICYPIEARYNSIWTPGSLVIGPNHDGATQGKNTCTIPLAGVNPFDSNILQSAGIKKGNWPYVEVVHTQSMSGHYQAYLTQLRDGLIMPSVQGNYVPKDTTVLKVVHADPEKYKDTTWKVEMESYAGQPGVVVWYPGGAMTSHFAIHAVAGKIPILFDATAPEVGSLLKKTSNSDITFDAKAMLKGFIAATKLDLSTEEPIPRALYGRAALGAIHHSTAMTGEASKWIGMGAGILLRLGIAALQGEARHFARLHYHKETPRDTIYRRSFDTPLSAHRAKAGRLINLFRYGKWTSPSFGGLKWAYCGATVVEVLNAVQRLAVEQTEDSASALIKSLNLMVNQAHNGGWWFNKFLAETDFDLLAQGQIGPVVASAPVFYQLNTLCNNLTNVESEIKKIQNWKPITLVPPRAQAVTMVHVPHINALEISVSSRVIPKKFRTIQAKISRVDLLKGKNLKDLRKQIFLVEGDHGYKVEYHGGPTPEVIWAESNLSTLAEEAAAKK